MKTMIRNPFITSGYVSADYFYMLECSPFKRLSMNSITSVLLTKMRRFLYLLEQNKTTIRLYNSKTTNPSF